MAADELPENVRGLLWDVGADVSLERHGGFLIDRVLAHGDWDAQRWLRREAGDAAIRARLEHTRGRHLSRRQIRFWQVLLELPEELVAAWLRDPARAIWDQRTA